MVSWVMGRRINGVINSAGSNSISPITAFPEIAHWVLTAAMAPISRVPKGVPAPIQTQRSPIILPRMRAGADNIVTVLCIVLKPA